jgi:hypothetical protein
MFSFLESRVMEGFLRLFRAMQSSAEVGDDQGLSEFRTERPRVPSITLLPRKLNIPQLRKQAGEACWCNG